MPKLFELQAALHFVRAARSVPARIKKRFLVRSEAKAGGNLIEDQNKRSQLGICLFPAKFLCYFISKSPEATIWDLGGHGLKLSLIQQKLNRKLSCSSLA